MGTLDLLTPKELQIALLLSTGPDAGRSRRLFLSPKTVGYHLRHVYQKFCMGSSAELREALDSMARPRTENH